jgi:hypothetical protein
MLTKSMVTPLLTLTLAGAICGQTKFAGELRCRMIEPVHTLTVGDRPDHTFNIGKSKCVWAEPLLIEGLTYASHDVTYFNDLTGDKGRGRGAEIGTMNNGDKVFVNVQSVNTVKNNVLQSSDVTWTWTGGTGKLKGVTAKGTSKCRGTPDGNVACAVEGEYQFRK